LSGVMEMRMKWKWWIITETRFQGERNA
jgi:hypothetical protein